MPERWQRKMQLQLVSGRIRGSASTRPKQWNNLTSETQRSLNGI